MRLGWVTLWCAIGCGAVLKPPEPDRRLQVRTTGSTFDSDRGYRFAVLPDPASRVVRLDLRYPLGSASDPVGKEGLAHLVEHLLFQVVIRRGETTSSVGAELGKLALSWNAVTEADHTTYEFTMVPSALEPVFGLLADQIVIGCGGLTPEIFAREREVVLNEMREKQGAYGALQRTVHEAVFPDGHPYRRIATVESVAKLELKDACELLASSYQRGAAIVVATGDVTEGSIQDAAAKHLRRVRKRLPTVASTIPPISPQPGTARLRGAVDDPTLLATWALPPMSTAEYRTLALAWPAIASRLEAFAFTYGWGHSADGYVLGGAHAPVLAVSIALNSKGQVDEAISSAKKAAEHAARAVHNTIDGDDDAVWIAHREAGIEQLLARWEVSGARTELVADMFQFEPQSQLLVGRVAELQQTRGGRARAIVENWLAPSKARFLVIEPNGDTSPPLRSAFGGKGEAHGAHVDGTLADQPLPLPKAGMRLTAERFQLGNGLTVVMWPHGTAPLVHGRLVVDSGHAHAPAAMAGLATLVGADATTADHLVFYSRSLSTRVDDLVRQLAFELRSPGYGFSDEEKAYLKARLRTPRVKERAAYERELATALYGAGHPYAQGSLDEASIGAISHDKVTSWARGHIAPKNAVLVLAGNLDPALVKKHVAYNADQVSGGSDSSTVTVPPQTRAGFVRGDSTQPSHTVDLEVAFVAGRGVDADHAHRLILAEVLETELGTLREEKAVTYGVTAAYVPRHAGGLWRIGGSVDANRSAEAAKAMWSALDRIRRDPESYRGAFVLARRRVLEGLFANGSSSAAAIERLVLAARFDLSDEHDERLAARVAATVLSAFHAFVQRELAAERQVFGAFGNEMAVDSALSALRR